MRHLQLVVGWACVVLLVWFVATNWESTSVWIVSARLTAPLGLVVVLAAILGAVGAEGFKTVFSWLKRDKKR